LREQSQRMGLTVGEAAPGAGMRDRSWSVYAGAAALCLLLYWLSAEHPSVLPVWAPWDFSVPVFLATWLTVFWFVRGLVRTPAAERLPAWRCTAFLAGMVLVYAVLQTRFEYWSQHMFFLNRLQHVAMHHLAPVLIALGFAGGTLGHGAPDWVRGVAGSRPVRATLNVLQQPFLAAFLFVGLFYFWLVPSVHFRAMIDPQLYAVMNWSMVLDGVLFWSLVLDPRPKPPARATFGMRAALALAVMFPQILLGALITFADFDIYPYYNLCGRLFPSMGAIDDQQIGGIVIWIPPAMMSVLAMVLALNAMRLHDEREERRNVS
jgi:putative membrane protein